MDNHNQIHNTIIDCGADEYNSTVSSLNNYTVNITIAPNPVYDIITINDLDNIAEYEIYSIYGSLIANGKVISNQIDLSKLKNGIYILNLVNSNQERFYTEKIKKL